MKRIKSSKLLFLVVFLLGLTPILWFFRKGNVLITGSDTNFPLDPSVWFHRRLFTWQSVQNLGSSFSSSTAGTFFHLLQFIPYTLGVSLQKVEIINLVFWFLVIAFAALILARQIFPTKKMPQLIFIVLYSLNIYMFNTWENVKVANLALVAAIPLGFSILIMLRERKISRAKASLFSILTGIILSGAGINPAYIICFYFLIFLFLVAEILVDVKNLPNILERLKDFLIVGGFIAFVNMFWILPTLSFIFTNITAQASIGKIGFSDWVDSLSQNTSLINVLRMQGAWDWYSFDSGSELPLYIPYALRYFSNPFFIGFSFLIPFFAFAAYVVRKEKSRLFYLTFGLMLAIGLFLTAGTHPPTGVIFRFLANHVPFFSLFRSPWYIFSPLVGLAIAGLVGLFFSSLDEIFTGKKVLVTFGGIVFVVLFLFYSYPLLLGRIFRPSFPDNFYITFPSYVYQTRDFLNNTPERGRIFSYPDDNIERFSWGYNAVDSILNLFSKREIVYASINDTTSPLSKIVTNFYEAIKRDEISKAKIIADKLGVGEIFYKADQVSLTAPLPKDIANNQIASFGKWNFYNFPAGNPTPKIYSASCCTLSYPYEKSDKNLQLVDADSVLVNPNDSLLKNIKTSDSESAVILATNSQVNDFESSGSNPKLKFIPKDLSIVEFDFHITDSDNYQPILERYALDSFGLIGTKFNVNIDGIDQVWSVSSMDDSFVYFSQVKISEGNHKVIFKLVNNNLINPLNFVKIGDGLTNFSDGEFSIFNDTTQAAGLEFPVSNFDPYSYYLISLDYKQVYGSNATFVVDQKSSTTLFKSQSEQLPNYPEWENYNLYYSPVESNTGLFLKLSSPSTKDALGTKVMYRNLSVKKVFSNNLFFKSESKINESLPEITFKENSSVSYSGDIKNASESYVVFFNENYSPDWILTIPGIDPSRIIHFTANSCANGWYVDSKIGNYKFSIYNKSQRLLEIGYVISGLSIVISVLYLVSNRIKRK